MSKINAYGPETLSLHAGQKPDLEFGSRAQPIYFTTSYVFESTDQASSLFNMERGGHVYSRISNPTSSALEERVASLEGGVGGIATSSGQAALHLALATLLSAGDHIVSSGSLYGGSHNLLSYTMPRFGINTTFVNLRDTDSVTKAIRPNTKIIFGETLGNPGLDIMNIPVVSKIAHDNGIPLLVDSTLSTPYLIKPFEFGADIIFHSATKFLGGHGVAIGGVLVDGGKFDWEATQKFPTLTQPYEGFHNMIFSEESATNALLLRARREGLRDFGACISPMNAFQILQGVETLTLRMEKHIYNTREIVSFLQEHPAVKSVSYPELKNHPDHQLAKELMPRGCGAVFTFELKGGMADGRTLIENLELFSHLANVGDSKSLVIHPASTTHHRMSSDSLKDAGISESTVRLSIGLEDSNDLIKDLKKALRYCQTE